MCELKANILLSVRAAVLLDSRTFCFFAPVSFGAEGPQFDGNDRESNVDARSTARESEKRDGRRKGGKERRLQKAVRLSKAVDPRVIPLLPLSTYTHNSGPQCVTQRVTHA